MAQKIIVIGAGIIGASTAYQLCKTGADVTVLDAGVASATRASFGWINASFFLDDDHFRLRADAIDAYRALSAELSLPVNWCGCLCFDETGDAFDAQAAKLDALGYAYDVIDGQAFSALVPQIAKPPARCLKFAQEAAAESGDLADRLLAAAVALGARVIRGVAATGFDVTAGKVSGVQTTAGILAADQIVSAVGTATTQLLAQIEVPLPLLTRPAVMLKTRPVPPMLDHILVTEIGEVRQLPD